MMIATTSQLADWQKAGHWSEAATAWCNRQAINGFPGVCRVHRAEIMKLRGSFSEAEEEARVATIELASFNVGVMAAAYKELGDIRVKLGDLDAAEDAFRQASEMGVMTQPGHALLLLQRGRPQAAATALRRALAHPDLSLLDRAKLLPARIEVALLMGELDVGRAAAEELDKIATVHDVTALRATADGAAAAVAFADCHYDDAIKAALHARELFDSIDLSYESARVTMLLGRIHQAKGDTALAREELNTALSVLEAIGAMPDATTARELLAAV